MYIIRMSTLGYVIIPKNVKSLDPKDPEQYEKLMSHLETIQNAANEKYAVLDKNQKKGLLQILLKIFSEENDYLRPFDARTIIENNMSEDLDMSPQQAFSEWMGIISPENIKKAITFYHNIVAVIVTPYFRNARKIASENVVEEEIEPSSTQTNKMTQQLNAIKNAELAKIQSNIKKRFGKGKTNRKIKSNRKGKKSIRRKNRGSRKKRM
jgi:hypothetical protein